MGVPAFRFIGSTVSSGAAVKFSPAGLGLSLWRAGILVWCAALLPHNTGQRRVRLNNEGHHINAAISATDNHFNAAAIVPGPEPTY
jgi:hypothetical protein